MSMQTPGCLKTGKASTDNDYGRRVNHPAMTALDQLQERPSQSALGPTFIRSTTQTVLPYRYIRSDVDVTGAKASDVD